MNRPRSTRHNDAAGSDRQTAGSAYAEYAMSTKIYGRSERHGSTLLISVLSGSQDTPAQPGKPAKTDLGKSQLSWRLAR